MTDITDAELGRWRANGEYLRCVSAPGEPLAEQAERVARLVDELRGARDELAALRVCEMADPDDPHDIEPTGVCVPCHNAALSPPAPGGER